MAESNDYTLVHYLYGESPGASGGGNSTAGSNSAPQNEIVVRDEGNVIAKTIKDINFVGPGVNATYDAAQQKIIVAVQGATSAPGNTSVTKTNNSGSIIPQWAVVSERPNGTVALATASAVQDEEAFGIATVQINNSASGDVQVTGEVPNALTGLGFAPETPVYVGNVPGVLTNAYPSGPGQLIYLVGYASGSSGEDLRLEMRKIGRNSV